MLGSKLLRVPRHVFVRFASTAADPANTRNIALTAHIDSGKTTLTESILHISSYLKAPGSVDTGSTTTDFLPAERERGITIQSASIPVDWKHWRFNLVDTPGHADFGMEVESASGVVDGAVVLMDAVEGVEAQTKGVWRQLDRHSVPTRIMFINKLDRPGASFYDSIHSLLANRLHPCPAVLNIPVASFDNDVYQRGEPGIEGLVDLVKWEVWKWSGSRPKPERFPLPRTEKELSQTDIFPLSHPIIPHLLPARTQLIDSLCTHSSELLEDVLSSDHDSPYLALPAETIIPPLRQLTLQKDVLPVLCGSALKHIGTEMLMDYVGALLASPTDITPLDTSSGHLEMMAWKVGWDKRRGWLTFVRIYSGTLTRQSTLLNTKTGQRERVSKLLLLYASQPKEVDSLPFGSIGVILGLKHTRTGDILVSVSDDQPVTTTVRSIIAPPAVISASVIPRTHADLTAVQDALTALTRTDPSVRVAEEDGQTLVSGLGSLHLEIVEGRLKDEWAVECQFGKRRVSYRESFNPGDEFDVRETWTKDIGGKTATATVGLRVRSLMEDENGDGAWGGNIVVLDGRTCPPPELLPFQPPQSHLPQLLQGIQSTLLASPHTSLPFGHLHITIVEHTLGPSSHPTAMTAASAAAFRSLANKAGPGPIMEPFVRVKVDLTEETMGKVVKDLGENNGEILDLAEGSIGSDATPYSPEGLYVPPKWLTPCASAQTASAGSQFKRTVHAIAPLAKMLDYSNRLRAVSGGQAVFEMSNEGFRAVGPLRRQEILREMGRA